MYKVISILTLISTIALAGANGDRESSPFAMCTSTLNNNKNLVLEMRSWSFPFQLTGTVFYEGQQEPVGFNVSGGRNYMLRQTRPLRFEVAGNLMRDSWSGEVSGEISVTELPSRKTYYGSVT